MLVEYMKTKEFYWGASTSSHQIEGGTVNQWSVWELENASELAKNAPKKYNWLPNWDKIKDQACRPENYVSGTAVDHYNRFREDFEILEKLNLNAFRFGIEWSRIEPEEGVWSEAALNHYREYIKELKKRDIEPFVTLWHWTMPTWFIEKGGFEKIGNLKYFENYIKKISDELLEDVEYVITLNEPNVYAGNSFIVGEWPPQKKNIFLALWSFYITTKAHKIAWKAIKGTKPLIKIGSAPQLGNIEPYRVNSLIDKALVKIIRYFWNWWWLDKVRKYQDFIGFNYYFTDYFKIFKRHNPSGPINDLGWYMEPKGILNVMRWLAKRYPGKPIIIVENGLADSEDKKRKWWLEETINAVDIAKAENIPIIGYMHWSLLDNFEWAEGWWPKFGLVKVDREHGMKREVRPSALWFATEIAKRRKE